MVILGEPKGKDIKNYYECDKFESLELQKAGFKPRYKSESNVYYFKLNYKLEEYLREAEFEY